MKRKIISFLLVTCLIFTICAPRSKAASGKIYNVNIDRSYRNPITGQVEDSGGESSLEIGQGMVEGAVNSRAILEETSSGELYLTIKMSLFDYTSNHSFWINQGGDSWYSPQAGVTGHGSDSNGTTGNITIKVPSKDCVLKGGMYVEPMGRDVIWFMTLNILGEGNNTDIEPSYVSENSQDQEDNLHNEASDNSTSSSEIADEDKENSNIKEDSDEDIKEEQSQVQDESLDKADQDKESKDESKSNVNDKSDNEVKADKENPLPSDKQVKTSDSDGLKLSTEEKANGLSKELEADKDKDTKEAVGLLKNGKLLIAVGAGVLVALFALLYVVEKKSKVKEDDK